MNKKLLTIPILVLILLMSVGIVAAQDRISAEIILPPTDTLTVGDPLPLTLELTHPTGYTVLAPDIPAEWGDLTVVRLASAETIDNGNGTETTRIPIDARLFTPGDFQTPPLFVSVTDGSGQLIETIAAPVAVSIGSVLIEGDTSLRDIKPQANLPFNNLLPWIIGGTALALLGGGAAFWLTRRNKQAASIDTRLPHEWAVDELDRIAGLAYPAAGQYKAHYTAVVDTLRIYLARTYNISITERTTGEVSQDLRSAQIDRDLARSIVNLLDDADLVKFSTFTPTAESANSLLANARDIIEASKPLIIEERDIAAANQPVAHTFSANGQMKKMEAGA